MISFSYRSFREYLKSNLEKSEIRFIVRTFGYASIYFLLFGVFLCVVYSALESVVERSLENWSIYAGCNFFGLISSFPLMYFAIKYRNNPLRVPTSFVAAIFSLLTISFLFWFIGISGVLGMLASTHGYEVRRFVYSSIATVFGLSFVIYLIPCFFALAITNRKKIMTVGRFLNTIYVLYFLLFVIFLLTAFLGMGVSSFFGVLSVVLVTIILFVSPVLTVYRLKTVAQFINYEDPYERRRWENYFSFEIAYQLLQMALHLARLFIHFFISRSSSFSRIR